MLLEKILHAPFYFSGGKPLLTWFGNKILFLTLHRVRKTSEKGDSFNDFIDITNENLEQIIIHLKKQNVRFVSLAEIDDDMPANQVCVHFTIDDGYKDIVENALPIFEKYKVPFTLFLATGIPDRDALLWWYVNAEILNRNQNLNLKTFGLDVRPGSLSLSEKAETFQALRVLFLNKYATNKQEMDDALNASGVKGLEITENLGLSWQDVRVLQQSALFSLGLHTHHHFRLSSISESIAEAEIKYCYQRLSDETNVQSGYFAFPFGAANDNMAIEKINGVSLTHCFTTESGIIKKITSKNRYYIPRYFVNNGTTGYSLNMIINGMRFYTNKLLYS